MTLAEYRNKAAKAEGRKELLQKQVQDTTNRIKASESRMVALELAQVFLQNVAKETQDQLSYQIEDVVQMALDTCFPEEYLFSVDFVPSRGKTEAQLRFMKNGQAVDPMEGSGGGVVDLASFALRIAAWSLGRSSPTIVLDEPFRFLSRELQPKAGAIMKELSQQLGLQFIMVTHNQDIINVADRIFEVLKIEDISRVEVRNMA